MTKGRYKDNKNWPKNVYEVVERVISVLSEKDKNSLKNSAFNDLIQFHFSLGMWIRNKFSLWNHNKEMAISLIEKFPNCVIKLYDFEHVEPDSASMIIIEEVWKRLQEE